jgi:hypothetical protein
MQIQLLKQPNQIETLIFVGVLPLGTRVTTIPSDPDKISISIQFEIASEAKLQSFP